MFRLFVRLAFVTSAFWSFWSILRDIVGDIDDIEVIEAFDFTSYSTRYALRASLMTYDVQMELNFNLEDTILDLVLN